MLTLDFRIKKLDYGPCFKLSWTLCEIALINSVGQEKTRLIRGLLVLIVMDDRIIGLNMQLTQVSPNFPNTSFL